MPVAAKRSFGQCFLVDGNVARIIAQEATTPVGGATLEIGAGTGALTAPLLLRAARVIAIERDRDLVPVLRQRFEQSANLQVVEDDAATADWGVLLHGTPRPHILAGNLPYQLTGRILQRTVELSALFDRAVFMLQKEVALRLTASPGCKDYGALTVFVGSAFHAATRLQVPASCFRPRPKVDSAVVVLTPRPAPAVVRTAAFAELVHAAFSQRRKTLRNAWKHLQGVEQVARSSGIDLDARGETLDVEAFSTIAERWEALKS
jgi:16S rRNA (adenine1518-N6/adenine1519-N6)-dimethyltransferase